MDEVATASTRRITDTTSFKEAKVRKVQIFGIASTY